MKKGRLLRSETKLRRGNLTNRRDLNDNGNWIIFGSEELKRS